MEKSGEIIAASMIESYIRSIHLYDMENIEDIHKGVIARMLDVAVQELGVNWISEAFVQYSPSSEYRMPHRFDDKKSLELHYEWREKLVTEAKEFIEKFIEENK